MESETNSNPIREITIYDQRTDTGSYTLTARIEEGKLVLEGYDLGELPKQAFGDSDYEYWLTVEKEYVPAVLLWLLKERFRSSSQFRTWLASKGIPSQFYSY